MSTHDLEAEGFRQRVLFGFFDASDFDEALLLSGEGGVCVAFGIPSEVFALLPAADGCEGVSVKRVIGR